MLLHKLDTFHLMMLVRSFCTFATVQLFKPRTIHGISLSFHGVAKNVQPRSLEAEIALESYKCFSRNAKFSDAVEVDEGDDGDQKSGR